MTTVSQEAVEVTPADREAYLSLNMLPEFDAIDVRAGRWDHVTGIQAFARHRTEALASQRALVEALGSAIAAIEDDRGLDDAICCSGHMCGCQAATHRQLLLHDLHAALTLTKAQESGV